MNQPILVTGNSEAMQTKRLHRSGELLSLHRNHIYCQSDRLFVVLMVIQWIAAIVISLVVSPTTWIGETPYLHIHVWAAVLFGGVISLAPILMALYFPGSTLTRHVVAIAQGSWSALLIHLSGGRLETHFHIFGSLAFLAFYRDWRVLITASAVVALDHMLRGVWWPQSVYGIAIETPYRWIEHAMWVVFEDVFLVISCLRGQREVEEICQRRADLEITNGEIEYRIQERTQELQDSQLRLESELSEHQRTQQEREKLYSELAVVSRQAGMAEVATGILHNVGNVLNSVNVSANLLVEKVKSSRVGSLVKAASMITEQGDALPSYLSSDIRGKNFPRLLEELATKLSGERDFQRDELQTLVENIEHIKAIVNMQQEFATKRDTSEQLSIVELVENALKICSAELTRHRVSIQREFGEVPLLVADKHKILQVIVNLISNAKHAACDMERDDKSVTVSITCDSLTVAIQVRDNGIGIAPDNLSNIFKHGFTTKKDGHGFGLHNSAINAQDLGGSLLVHSEGIGRGATFTLRLPIKHKAMPATSPRVEQKYLTNNAVVKR